MTKVQILKACALTQNSQDKTEYKCKWITIKREVKRSHKRAILKDFIYPLCHESRHHTSHTSHTSHKIECRLKRS